MHIKDLNLTDDDFKMIIEGLDALPEKGAAGEILGDLMIGMIGDQSNPDRFKQIKQEREKQTNKEKYKKNLMIEDIKILQGKLLMFKRWLIENDALRQTNEILTSKGQGHD